MEPINERQTLKANEWMNGSTRRMLKVAKTHNVNFATIKLVQRIQEKLPAWLLTGSEHLPINNNSARCLIHKHKAMTITDLLRVSARLRNNTERALHHDTNYCRCPHCLEDYANKCTHPNDCAKEALDRHQCISPKSNPLYARQRQ